MSLWALPHDRNGARCICGEPVYLTSDGWRDRHGKGRHREPTPRRYAW